MNEMEAQQQWRMSQDHNYVILIHKQEDIAEGCQQCAYPSPTGSCSQACGDHCWARARRSSFLTADYCGLQFNMAYEMFLSTFQEL